MDSNSLIHFFQTFSILIFLWVSVSITLCILCLFLTYRHIRNLNIPPDADLTETLQQVPLLLVLAIDFLDLGLDIFAAPFTWIILDRMGLKALRNVSTIEAIIPLTNAIPTLTMAWIAVRFFGVRF